MKKIITASLLTSLFLVGCGNGESTSNDSKTKQDTAIDQPVVEEKDVALTDSTQREAAEFAKNYIASLYSNTDFSNALELKGIEYMKKTETSDWIEFLAEELSYSTNNGENLISFEKFIVTEVVELKEIDPEKGFDEGYLVNLKGIGGNENSKGFETPGFLVGYNKSDSTFKIDWYNLRQHLTEVTLSNEKTSVALIPMNETEENMHKIAKDVVKSTLTFTDVKDKNDTKGMENLWAEEEREGFIEVTLANNENVFTNLKKEQYPEVNDVKIVELLPVKEHGYNNVDEVYVVNVEPVYTEKRESFSSIVGVVMIKRDREFWVKRLSPGYIDAWDTELLSEIE